MTEEKSSKKSSCLTIFLILIGVLVLIYIIIGFQGAVELRDSYRDDSLSSSKVYRITRETGFYNSFMSETYTETLPTGTKVKPANNSSNLDCRTADFDGISITSCWVEIVSSGQTGWVLKNTLGN